MRIDLTDTTFIIPVRIDSMIRLENLLMSVDSIVQDQILEYPRKAG